MQKNGTFLRSFPFFAKERNVLLGLVSRQKLEKRTEKNGTFFFWTEKNVTYWTEKIGVPNPDCRQVSPLFIYSRKHQSRNPNYFTNKHTYDAKSIEQTIMLRFFATFLAFYNWTGATRMWLWRKTVTSIKDDIISLTMDATEEYSTRMVRKKKYIIIFIQPHHRYNFIFVWIID